MSKPNNEPLAEDILRLADSLADDNATNDDELRRQLQESGIDPDTLRARFHRSATRIAKREQVARRPCLSLCAKRSKRRDLQTAPKTRLKTSPTPLLGSPTIGSTGSCRLSDFPPISKPPVPSARAASLRNPISRNSTSWNPS